MKRTLDDFSKAYDRAIDLVQRHNKSFWIIPTEDGYEVSCFKQDNNLPDGTNALEVKTEDLKFYG